jgi:hypothetical protein
MRPGRRALLLLTTILIASAAQAASSQSSAAKGNLRGSAGAAPTRAPATSPPPPVAQDQQAPGRSDGLGGEAAQTKIGGAQCRLSCAEDLYVCRADRDESDCSPTWSRCVAACPEDSSSPL